MDELEIAAHLRELVEQADAGDLVDVSTGYYETAAAHFTIEEPRGGKFLVLVVAL